MAEIDRVYSAVTAFFDSSGEEHIDGLFNAIEKCIFAGERRYHELFMKDPEPLQLLKTAREQLEALRKNLPADRELQKEAFKSVARSAMLARRSTYPRPGDTPWATRTVEEALDDPNDPVSFSLFDTLAEDIQALLPSLYQLAVEGDWTDDQPTED